MNKLINITVKDLLDNLRKDGYVRVRIDNEEHDLSETIELSKTKKHNIDVVIDRLIIKDFSCKANPGQKIAFSFHFFSQFLFVLQERL